MDREDVNWTELAQDRIQRWAFVMKTPNIPVPQQGIFLLSRVIWPRKTQYAWSLAEISYLNQGFCFRAEFPNEVYFFCGDSHSHFQFRMFILFTGFEIKFNVMVLDIKEM
jgi:hypothetical protein